MYHTVTPSLQNYFNWEIYIKQFFCFASLSPCYFFLFFTLKEQICFSFFHGIQLFQVQIIFVSENENVSSLVSQRQGTLPGTDSYCLVVRILLNPVSAVTLMYFFFPLLKLNIHCDSLDEDEQMSFVIHNQRKVCIMLRLAGETKGHESKYLSSINPQTE